MRVSDPEVSKLVRGNQNIPRTRSLFADVAKDYNLSQEELDNAPYWLERSIYTDKRPVMKEFFLLEEDPTGYSTAIKFFGSYDHWLMMMRNSTWFREAVERLKEELYIRLKSKSVKRIAEIAFNPEDRQSLAAAKYLATADYDKSDGRGRPSKAEVTGKLKEAVQIAEADKEDMERIGLRLVTSSGVKK